MGKRLTKAFDLAKQAGGLPMQMRLVLKTGISSKKAETEPDNSETIQKMEAALNEILGKEVRL